MIDRAWGKSIQSLCVVRNEPRIELRRTAVGGRSAILHLTVRGYIGVPGQCHPRASEGCQLDVADNWRNRVWSYGYADPGGWNFDVSAVVHRAATHIDGCLYARGPGIAPG